MNDHRKQGTVYPWANNGKSISAILKTVTLAALIIPAVIFFGNAYWFPKEKGEAIEKRQVVLELELNHRHEMHMQEQKHIYEKLDELKEILER